MEPITINVKVELGPKTTELLQNILKGTAHAPEAKAPEAAPASEPDMPDLSPEPAKEITDADLRAVVKEAKDRAGVKAVRDCFAKFNISSSMECPADRRTELVAALENLK